MSDKVYTVKEVAELFKVSESVVRGWVANNNINFIKVGGAVRFTKETIEQALRQGVWLYERFC